MANVQLQKTVTKTAIDQKQSQDVVQTMMHGALSSLAYLRYFFPDKAFEERFYEMSEKLPSYADYAAGKLTKDELEATSPKTKMQILRRGRSRRADMFLDWLEQGVFKAIEDGNFQALQVYIHPDDNDRQRVIEQYTFAIKYLRDNDGGRILTGMEMHNKGNLHINAGE